ncbi:7985_t:CDS:2, partial [Scutellospora calospora]
CGLALSPLACSADRPGSARITTSGLSKDLVNIKDPKKKLSDYINLDEEDI